MTRPNAYVADDPGTGKTRVIIELIARLKARGEPHRALVICPKTIIRPSWVADIEKYSDLTWDIADAKRRGSAVASDADIVIANHDGVKALAEENLAPLVNRFSVLIIDEATAMKHIQAQRSKAAVKLAHQRRFTRRILLCGTPNPNTVLDLWNQYFILDAGLTLGPSFYKFRHIACEPKQNGQFMQWEDKPDIGNAIAAIIAPITIRHKLEDVLDLPPNHMYRVNFDLGPKVALAYREFKAHTLLELQQGRITALNAGAKLAKLLQIASGAVYVADGAPAVLGTERYELILDLIRNRQQCVVAFNWTHQRDTLLSLIDQREMPCRVIDGATPDAERTLAVQEFQSGKLRLILAHPASAAHGLTLTKGTTTIWASPTWSSEHFTQFNRRIYRAGQTQRTETILIAANGTADEQVYAKLDHKLDAMGTLLHLLDLDPKELHESTPPTDRIAEAA